jgi:hypothetical protein
VPFSKHHSTLESNGIEMNEDQFRCGHLGARRFSAPQSQGNCASSAAMAWVAVRGSGCSGIGLEYGSAGLGLIVGQQARAPVAGLSFAVARANPPQLLGRLVEEEVGKGGHGSPFGMTIDPVERAEKQEK